MAKETVTGNGTSFNTISKGCKITGQITADSDVRIDGQVEGEIVCKGKIVLGAEGQITGPITCANAEILGSTKGDMKVSDTLTLRSTAKINGNIRTKVLVVEPNAIFNGACSMMEEKK
jgi:cytoskeletal protein CcmA (bactofilin family)